MPRFLALALATAFLAAVPAPAFASPFPNPDGTDAMDASEIKFGKSTLDTRIDFQAIPGNDATGTFNVNFFTGVWDGIELGGGVNANGTTPSSAGNVDATYLYTRLSLPQAGDLASALAIGSTFAYGGTDVQPGALLIGNYPIGDFTAGYNLGYGRNLTNPDNIVTANLNGAYQFDGWQLFEEQHIDYPLSGSPTGAFRFSMFSQISDVATLDINLGALWAQSPTGLQWGFNPNFGVMWRF